MSMKPHKWGGSHTEEINLLKGLPKHLRGTKETDKALKEIYELDFLIRSKKTGEWHVSLNPRKKNEIYKFLRIPPQDRTIIQLK